MINFKNTAIFSMLNHQNKMIHTRSQNEKVNWEKIKYDMDRFWSDFYLKFKLAPEFKKKKNNPNSQENGKRRIVPLTWSNSPKLTPYLCLDYETLETVIPTKVRSQVRMQTIATIICCFGCSGQQYRARKRNEVWMLSKRQNGICRWYCCLLRKPK